MTKLTRRRLLGGVAAASLPVALPAAAEGLDDLGIVQMLIDAHKDAVQRWDDLPDVWPDDEAADAEIQEAGDQVDRTAEALCFYRPTSLEGIHAKAEFMITTQFFVDFENEDFFSVADLISGFLPAGKVVKPWAEDES
jgi:hypothetical protein